MVHFVSSDISAELADSLFALDAQGNPYAPSWYTLNLRTQFDFNKSLSVVGAIENITNQRYRTFSSGISAPGTNLILRLHINCKDVSKLINLYLRGSSFETSKVLCLSRPLHIRKLSNKLKQMRMIPEAIEIIIVALIEDNYLNEERFAKAFVRGKFSIKKWGKVAIDLRTETTPAV